MLVMNNFTIPCMREEKTVYSVHTVSWLIGWQMPYKKFYFLALEHFEIQTAPSISLIKLSSGPSERV